MQLHGRHQWGLRDYGLGTMVLLSPARDCEVCKTRVLSRIYKTIFFFLRLLLLLLLLKNMKEEDDKEVPNQGFGSLHQDISVTIIDNGPGFKRIYDTYNFARSSCPFVDILFYGILNLVESSRLSPWLIELSRLTTGGPRVRFLGRVGVWTQGRHIHGWFVRSLTGRIPLTVLRYC